MEVDERLRAQAQLAASVLLRCFALGMALLLFWFVFFLVGTDLAVAIHGRLFSVTREQLIMLNYVGMGLFKLVIFAVFLIPYVAIRWTLRTNASD